MATVVCQGLQSCLESQLIESRTIKLKLSTPKPHFTQSLELALKSCFLDSNTKERNEEADIIDHKSQSLNPDMGGWSFLQALSNPCQGFKESTEKENMYVHPLLKRSSSRLSEKSLELCTESLGSETGTDIIEDCIFLSASMDSKFGISPTREQKKYCQLVGASYTNRKVNTCGSFPPPLTTISGAESLQVRPHREDGRLIIKAEKVPSPNSCFQVERCHGRLRLSFVKDSASDLDYTFYQHHDEIKNEINYNEEEEEEEEEEVDEEKYEEESGGEEDTEGNNLKVEGEMGTEEIQTRGRCKEGGGLLEKKRRGLLNWEASWVATS